MFIPFPPSEIRILGMENITIPKLYRIRQDYTDNALEHPERELEQVLSRILTGKNLRRKRIAVTAGSRGVPGYAALLREICRTLRAFGAQPFVVPAMGSHGGATAEGQRQLLAGYGIREETIGAPIESSMQTVQYGKLGDVPLLCDKLAFESDGILLFNKVKPHTDFRGEVESGLCKMAAIGLGKHAGASVFHQQGFSRFAALIPQVAQSLIATRKVLGGVGIVQNAYDQICAVDAAEASGVLALDKRLQTIAKENIPRFKCPELDVLVIEQIGKNISGSGFDPNIVGRTYTHDPGFDGILKLQKLVICSVSPESERNGVGIALSDVSTRRCLESIDWSVLWTNSVTSTELANGRIPIYMNSDKDAILLAIRTCNHVDASEPKLAKIRNTLCMQEIEVSEALYRQLITRSDVSLVEGPYEMRFDSAGNFPGLF